MNFSNKIHKNMNWYGDTCLYNAFVSKITSIIL